MKEYKRMPNSTNTDMKRIHLEKSAKQTGRQQESVLTPEAAQNAQSISQRTPVSSAPLSFAQRQCWQFMQLTPNRVACNQCFVLSMPGQLDVHTLEESLHMFILRHEMWRSSFRVVNGMTIQVTQPDLMVPLTEIELRHLPESWRENTARRLATEDALQPFDLGRCPLFRVLLMHFSDTDHRLFFTLHHLIFDGFSVYQILLPELSALYHARVSSTAAQLPTLSIQYADFANWQQQAAQKTLLAPHMTYWQEQLAGAPSLLALPTDYSRLPVRSYRGHTYPFMLPKKLSEALTMLSQREGVTLHTTLLAVFQTLLYRYSEQDDLVVGTTTTGRNRPETRLLMGLFTNIVPLRIDLSGNPTFRTFLQQVRAVLSAALAHDELPFEVLLRTMYPDETPDSTPLVQVMLTLETPHQVLPSDWRIMQMNVDMCTARFDLTLELDEQPEGLAGRFIYRTDLFETATIERMAGHWQTLLEAVVAQPEQHLSELALLTRAELFQTLVEWNRTQTPYPPMLTVQHLFEAQVGRNPDAFALDSGEEHLTYRELNERANQLAHRLRQLGVGLEVPVGLCVERSFEMVIGLLGILKAGGVCILIDPTYPLERLTFMLDDAQVTALVTRQVILKKLLMPTNRVVCFDTDREMLVAQRKDNPVIKSSSSLLALIVYTFGAAQIPSGLQVPQQAIVNALLSMHERPGIAASDSVLLASSRSFEACALEILLPLTVGARLALASQEVAASGSALIELLTRAGATVVLAQPETWRRLLEAGWPGHQRLKALCTCEVLPDVLVAQLLPRVSTLWHLYSPAETPIWATLWKVDTAFEDKTIGYPIANTQIYVLDTHGALVPVGMPGELWLAGVGLARGYLNRSKLTSERFIRHPWSMNQEARLFRTGERVCYRPDGSLDWLGHCEIPVPREDTIAMHTRTRLLDETLVIQVAERQLEQENRKKPSSTAEVQNVQVKEQKGIIMVQSGTIEPAFFFLHDVCNDEVAYCTALAHDLGEQQPFYALEPQPLHRSTLPPTLAQIAAAHVVKIRAIQPQGPYRLGGLGTAALVVYEMVRQLQADGQAVDLLVLADPPRFIEGRRLRLAVNRVGRVLHRSEEEQLYMFLWLEHLRRYLQHLYRMLRSPFYRSLVTRMAIDNAKLQEGMLLAAQARYEDAAREVLRRREMARLGNEDQNDESLHALRETVLKWPAQALLLPEHVFPPLQELRHDYASLFHWTTSLYQPGKYDGKCTFFFTRDMLKSAGAFWQQVSAEHDKERVVRTLAGTRDTCKDVYISVLAAHLRNSLDEVGNVES